MEHNKLTQIHLRLKDCRIKCNLTQREVADALGVNRSTYTYYELARSEPNLETLSRLSVIFKVDLPYLLGYEESPNPLGDVSLRPSNPIEYDDSNDLFFDKLSKDEKNLVVKFRMLSQKQKNEILANFGLSQISDTTDKDDN